MAQINHEKWRTRFVVAAIALLLAVFVFFALRSPPLAVDLGEIQRGELVVTIDEEGETRIHDTYIVSTPVGGRVSRTELHVGDTLVGGETIIAHIEPSDPAFLDIRTQTEAEAQVHAAEATLKLAEADLQRAIADHDLADAEFVRAEALSKSNTVSKAMLDRRQAEFKRAQANVQTVQASVDVARYQLERAQASLIGPTAEVGECCRVEVRAPVSGRVLRIVQASEAVMPAGSPLVEIGDPVDLEIVADLLSADAIKVRGGAEVRIEDWGGEKALNGQVHRVEPFGFTKVSALGVEEQRVNVIIHFADPPDLWAALGHGYRVAVKIVSWRGQDVLAVPTSALFREGGNWAVFLDSDGTAQLQLVEIGQRNDHRAEVLDGLTEGDRVVLHPSASLNGGMRIIPRNL